MYPAKTIYNISCPNVLSLHTTDEVTASKLNINGGDPDLYATMLRVVVPVEAGDYIRAGGWARVTNDLGYNVGVGWHFWMYDADNGLGASGEWAQISPLCGENVTPDMHHMPLWIKATYRVPDTWPAGHRAVVVLRSSGHSTAAKVGDQITVDKPYGYLEAERIREGA
ncbi:hypothetical protein [Streptomyces bobili]|uniref:hypothetical protein n=1 Tax=Streptomyces bobili TaxID=67280 RepID=UPI0037BD35F2